MNCPNCGKYYTSHAAFLACHTEFVDCINHLKVINDQLLRACGVASAALKSYQYGNSCTELAEETSNFCDAAIAAAKGDSKDTRLYMSGMERPLT